MESAREKKFLCLYFKTVYILFTLEKETGVSLSSKSPHFAFAFCARA